MNKPTVKEGQCWTFTEPTICMVLYIIQKVKRGFQTLLISTDGAHIDHGYEYFGEKRIHEDFEYNDMSFLILHGSPPEVLVRLISEAQKKERRRIRESNRIIKGLESTLMGFKKTRRSK